MTRRQIHQARVELEWLRARYDSGAISGAVFETIKQIESDISWSEHKEQANAN